MSSNIIQIGIVDDHAILRTSIKQLCSEQVDMRVVAEAANALEAVEIVSATALDVLILDLAMPGRSGVDVIEELHAKAPALRILVLTGLPQEQYAIPVMNRGAAGFLTKACEPGELLRAIRTVGQGQRCVPQEVEQDLAQTCATSVWALHEGLSTRHLEALLMLARGRSPDEVAKKMALSPKTVGVYRTHIMRTLGLRTSSHLTYYAVQHKLID